MNTELASSIGQRIKAKRIELGIGPGEMSDKLHCTPGMVNHYETGKHVPTVERLIVVAGILRCSTDYLLGLKPDRKAKDLEPSIVPS